MKDLKKELLKGGVKILREGEATEILDGFYAPATITLIKEGENNCLIDSGCSGEGKKILSLLGKADLTHKDITKVFLTHSHPDHIGNLELFTKAIVYFPDSVFRIDLPNYFGLIMQKDFYSNPGKSLEISKHIKLISTPGHAGWDFSVLYFKGKNRKILITGDLFWSQEDWEKDSEFLGLCVNPEMQKKSREYVKKELKPAIIIPRHGRAFMPSY